MEILIPIVLLTLLALLLAWRFLIGRRQPGYFAITEYWVYTPQEKLPPQEPIMDRMLAKNPHDFPRRPAIEAREGLLFSDIRLHIGLAKREKNPHIFRPDLFEENVVPSPEVLASLPECQSMVKLRYASQVPLQDTRHLQFMPHLADAVADLTQAKVIFDHIAEKIYTAQEFSDLLNHNNNLERPEAHVRVLWKEQSDQSFAVTLGLRKVGLPELKTEPQESDHEVIVTGLMMRLAYQLVRKPYESGPFEFDEFGDTFVFTLGELQEGSRLVHISRRRTV